MNKRQFIKTASGASLGLAAMGSLPALAAATSPKHKGADPGERRRSRFSNTALVTHDGKLVRFYDDLIKDRIVLINFMYARCGEICPGMTANLRKVQDLLGDRLGRDIFMYSLTLEPEHDTPEVLKSYAQLFKVKPGWTFLTGKTEEIEHLRKSLGFASSDPEADKDRTQHTGVVKFGIERLERWGMAAALGSPEAIAEYVRWMEPGAKPPSQSMLKGVYVDPGNITPGLVI